MRIIHKKMNISIHQPQYLPWLGYFDKIESAESFVLLDNVQFAKGSFQNRNRIRTNDGWIWLTVPVITKGHFRQALNEVEINNKVCWQHKHWQSIKINYNRAKHFKEHGPFLDAVYFKRWDRLVDLNVFITKYILSYLGIERKIYFASHLKIDGNSTDRLINICKCLNADTYLSGTGAYDYIDAAKFTKEKIKLKFQDFTHPAYNQLYSPFIPYMSIMDLIFNYGQKSLSILSGKLEHEYISDRGASG